MAKHARVDRDVIMGGPMNQPGRETSAGAQDSSEKEPRASSWDCGASGIKSRTLLVRLPSIPNNSVLSWIKRICQRSPKSQSGISN